MNRAARRHLLGYLLSYVHTDSAAGFSITSMLSRHRPVEQGDRGSGNTQSGVYEPPDGDSEELCDEQTTVPWGQLCRAVP